MKKVLSLILSVCMLMMSVQFTTMASTQTAEEIILSVADAEWTLTDDLATYGVSGADYGDASMGIKAVGIKKADGTTDMSTALSLEQLSDDIYVTYSDGIQKGAYKVMYYYPNFTANTTYTTGRNASILDSDLVITDANGTHTVTSTKPDISYGGWVDIGTYEFSGDGNDSIKVYVNQDNKVVAGQWKKTFLSAQVKLIPDTTDYSGLLGAVNSSVSVGDLKNAVKTYGSDFLDINALKYMDDAYQTMLEQKPEQGFKSAYQFKNVFDTAVEAELEKVTVESSSFVWQGSQANVDSFGYRINWEPVELAAGGDSRAVVTFKVSNAQNIKAMNLKLNPYTTTVVFSNNAIVSKYSSDVIELPNSNREQNKFMNSATFTVLDNPIKIAASSKDVTDDAIIAATQENGYISFYLIGDTVTYQGVTVKNNFALNASLEVVYDNTFNPNMKVTEADINTKAANTAKVFDIEGYENVDKVLLNNTELTAEQYSIKENRLKINGELFANAGEYTVAVVEGAETRTVVTQVAQDIIINSASWTTETGTTAPSTTWPATEMQTIDDNAAVYLDLASSNTHTSENTYVTYTGMPQGVYNVEYFVPYYKSSASYAAVRSSWIKDVDVDVTDKNETKTIKSVKDEFGNGGYVNIGTYEFTGTQSDLLKVYLNDEHKTISNSWNSRTYFIPGGIRLTPAANEELIDYYFDNGISYLDAVNNAKTINELKAVVNANDFVDTDALKNMACVYDAILGKTYNNENDFKRAFDAEIKKNLTSTTYVAGTAVVNDKTVMTNGILTTYDAWKNIRQIDNGGIVYNAGGNPRSYMTLTFADVDASDIYSAELDLILSGTLSHDVAITKTSSAQYSRTNRGSYAITDAETSFVDSFTTVNNVLINGADVTQIPVSMITDGYTSFYLEGYGDLFDAYVANSLGAIHNQKYTGATLTVYYDNSSAYESPNVKLTPASVNTETPNDAKVFELAGFETIEKVAVNETELTTEQYSIKENRLKINGELFANAGEYTVTVSDGTQERTTTANVSQAIEITNRTVTIPDGAETKAFNGNEWNKLGDIVAYVYADTYTANDTYAVYNGVPAGAYNVQYYVPSFTSAVSTHNIRSLSILDTTVSVKDKNSTKVTESTKTSVSGGGLVDLGTYEFAGDGTDEIKVYVNEDHRLVFDSKYGRIFAPGGLLLTPASENDLIDYYFENGIAYLDAVNAAATADELAQVVTANSFVDAQALSNMQTVYEQLIENDYTSVYEFKAAFDEAVAEKIVSVTYTAQVMSSSSAGKIRGLSVSQLINPGYYLVATFKDVNADNIIGADVKLDLQQLRTDIVASKYSYDKYDRPYKDELNNTNEYFGPANAFITDFTAFDNALTVTSGDTAQIDATLFDGMTDDKYISFYFEVGGAIHAEQPTYSNAYTSDVVMTVLYDSTIAVADKLSAAKMIACAQTLSAAKSLAETNKTVLGLEASDNSASYAVVLWGETVTTEEEVDTLLAKVKARNVIISNVIKTETDGNYILNVTVKNLSAEQKPIKLLTATYQNNAMKNVIMTTEPVVSAIDALSVCEVVMTISAADAENLKVFAIDNMTNMRPYDNAYIIE